jgi:geranylgeranyl diphosphate synthase, type II
MELAERSPFAETDDGLVQTMLREYGDITRRHLRNYLPEQEPRSYLYQLIADYPQRSGKMLRSSLCIAAAKALGAPMADVISSAVSIELLHNALLVHDDIEDGSEQRRGLPTLHSLHGVPLALNAGGALGLLSLQPLKNNADRIGPALALRIYNETERAAWESAEGQAIELGWRHENRTDVTDEDYLRMVLQKTCWLTTIHPLRVGCLIGARGRLSLEPLIRLGFFFGAAFQIRDDLLNLERSAEYGKERNGDLLEGKRTLMLIHALRSASGPERQRLTQFLTRPRSRRTATDVAWVGDLFERTGAIAHASTVASALAGAALQEFDAYFAHVPEGRDLTFIRNLITWVVRRTH